MITSTTDRQSTMQGRGDVIRSADTVSIDPLTRIQRGTDLTRT